MDIKYDYINTKLIYGLWFELKDWKIKGKKEYGSYKKFLDLIAPGYHNFKSRVDFSTGIKQLHTHGQFSIHAENDFRILSVYFLNENYLLESDKTIRVICQCNLEDFVKNCVGKRTNCGESTLEKLRNVLTSLLSYYDGSVEKSLHSREGCQRMIEELDKLYNFDIREVNYEQLVKEWSKRLYYYIYHAITNCIHSDLVYIDYPIEEELKEYNDKVTMMYGTSGRPGMYQLYSLADKNNTIALYECGEHEYYGKGPSGKINYQKAFDYYNRILTCKHIHPLAQWSIAYMQFEYLHSKEKSEEYRVVEIEDLINQGGGAIYKSIIEKVGTAYLYAGNAKAAAANLLGKIMECSDDFFPIVFRGIYNEKPAIDYYRESAEIGYVYGCNNYIRLLKNEINKNSTVKRIIQIAKEIRIFYEKAVLAGEPWASNQYALHLAVGWEINDVVVIAQDNRKAYKYFEYSMKMMNIQSYYWPLINICKYFWINPNSPKRKKTKEDMEVIIDLINTALSDVKEVCQIVELVYLKKLAAESRESEYHFSNQERWRIHQNCKENVSIDCVYSYNDFKKLLNIYEVDGANYFNEKIQNRVDEILLPKGVSSVCSICYGNKNNETLLHYFCEKNEYEDPIFDLASITKLFLALIFIKLDGKEFGEKKLSLENKIGYYSEDLFPNISKLRICDLLSFNVLIQTEDRLDDCKQYDEAFSELKDIRGENSINQIYSDMPMLVLAELLYEITGKRFHLWVKEIMIEPLGLTSTFWNYDRKLLSRCIFYENEMRVRKDGTVVTKTNKRGVVNDSKAFILSDECKNLCGSAGLFSSMTDISKIAKALLNEEIVSLQSLIKVVVATGWNKESRSNSFGYGCYRKHRDELQSEIPFILSPYTIAMSGFTGCYLAIDLLNEVYIFIGTDRLSNCISKSESECKEENGRILINGRYYSSSVSFPYKRNDLRNLIAEISLLQKYHVDKHGV